MTQDQTNYAKLFAHSKKIRLLESVSSLLEWDQETHMPPSAASFRGEQLELLASLIHKERTSRSFTSLLGKLVDLKSGKMKAKDLTALQKAALREWHRDYVKASALPNNFVKAFAKLASESMTVWAQARKENSFSLFAPYLEKIVDACRKKAELLGYKDHPYDALLDCFEPSMTVRQLDPLFSSLQEKISKILKKVSQCKQVNDSCIHGKFSEEKQLAFGKYLLESMGYDLKKGRLDLSTHPFSMSLHPSDSRVTTRLHPSMLLECVSTILHEGGHSLYEMGLQPEYYGSPICEAVSLGIHESQSRLWETRIGMSKPFWTFFFPKLKETFKENLSKVTLGEFYAAINKIEPSFIRVESDEVTYCLHVILRYEIEKALIKGELSVKEVPEAWNELMHRFLGIIPKTNREGCLQDVHWSMGSFGYFPTYALGNLYAAHFFNAFEKTYPDWQKKVSKGQLLFLRQWLQEMIHQHGRTYSAAELLKRIDGKSLSVEPYIHYLNEKYREIYRWN